MTWTTGPDNRYNDNKVEINFRHYLYLQVTLLEGRDACEFKLRAPLRFWSGRADCVSEDKDGRGYKAAKEENQPRLLGDAVCVEDLCS